MINELKKDGEARMKKSVDALEGGFSKVRTGRAHPAILKDILVPYYGTDTPLTQVANVGVEDARTLIIQEGEGGDAIYIVLAGRLRAFVSDTRGRQVTLGHHGPGEYVGEMSLDGGPRSASVEAAEPTTCVVVTRESVLRHLAEDPEFTLGLITRLIRRARLATESARSMALLDVYSRLRRVLEQRAAARPDGVHEVEHALDSDR